MKETCRIIWGSVGRIALLGELVLNDTKCWEGNNKTGWETVSRAA